jgi:phage tail P2-like protein
MGVPRTETQIEDYVYRLLPDYVRNDDDGTLAAFMGAATATAMGPGLRLADQGDPDTSVSGTAELANPDFAPRAWLAWLAWLVGIDLSPIPDAEKRAAITQASSLRRRGSTVSIVRAVQRTLTGSKSCRVYWNLDGVSPYELVVVTLTAQTPDSVESLEAALTEKPAGVELTLQDVSGSLYLELESEYAGQDYTDLAGDFTDYDDLADWEAPSP